MRRKLKLIEHCAAKTPEQRGVIENDEEKIDVVEFENLPVKKSQVGRFENALPPPVPKVGDVK